MIDSISKFSAQSFFSLSWACPYYKEKQKSILLQSKFQLPTVKSLLLEEDLFASLFLGWNEDGLVIGCDAMQDDIKVIPNDFRKGDSIEIFIDSRAVKSSGYLTKYCHHFVFFPESVDGCCGKEITRFSADEIHPLANPSDLLSSSSITKKSYQTEIFLPSSVIHGFDPVSFDRMGFAYRINRYKKSPQVFGSSEDLAKMEKNPAFWCEMQLVKK